VVVGILAHVDAGKTTLSEALLYVSGKIRNWEELITKMLTWTPMNSKGPGASLFFQAGRF